MTIGQWIGQGVAHAAFVATIGLFSTFPTHGTLEPGHAVVRLSFSHAGERREPCRRRTPEELAALAPNMRRPMDCARARVPLHVEIILDGEPVFSRSLPPGGIASDGASHAYERFDVPAGRHRIEARLRDSRRAEGFDYHGSTVVELAPRQSFIIDFDAAAGGFAFR